MPDKPQPAVALVRARHAAVTAEHAVIWRQISTSPAWQRLAQLEGAMVELEQLMAELDPPPPNEPATA
ncbi:hypothetical protein EKD04_009390 [Chloroflexales bacterium ZM16-3]|nr:hypothetical protein [Chloroflexales bacterium ZM16-3]